MALKYKLLIATLLLSLTAFSQTDTTKCTVTLSCNTARQVAADLVKKDSVEAELLSTQDELFLTQEMVELKDSIIATYIDKEEIYKQTIAVYKEKEKEYLSIIGKLEKANHKQRRVLKIFKTTTYAFLAATAVLLIAK